MVRSLKIKTQLNKDLEYKLNERIKAERKLIKDNLALKNDVMNKMKLLRITHRRLNEEIQEKKELIEDLDSSEKMAKLGHATTGVIHDLKNPIAIIKSAAKYLEFKLIDEDEELANLTEIMISSVDRIDLSINNLLDYARPNALILQHEDLYKMITDICNGLKIKALESRVKIITEIKNEIPDTLLDKEQFGRMLIC